MMSEHQNFYTVLQNFTDVLFDGFNFCHSAETICLHELLSFFLRLLSDRTSSTHILREKCLNFVNIILL